MLFGWQSRPYSFGVGECRDRSEGLDTYYDNSSNTMQHRGSATPRKYASAFQQGTGRTSGQRKEPNLGPGSYTIHDDCSCGGIIRGREMFRPSSVFVGRVGGKYAHLREEDWW